MIGFNNTRRCSRNVFLVAWRESDDAPVLHRLQFYTSELFAVKHRAFKTTKRNLIVTGADISLVQV